MNCTPEFYLVVPDDSLLGIGIQRGDSIFCDSKPGPAHYVIGVWDDLAHVCIELSDGTLFNAADNTEAPPEGYRCGRVLYVQHPLVNEAKEVEA